MTSEIVKKTIAAHDAIEIALDAVKSAIDDRRYRWTLEDCRAFRDMVDDIELMCDQAWRGSMQIPVERSKEAVAK